MNKNDLEQLKALKVEIKTLTEEIDRVGKTTAVDTVMGSRINCPWDPHPILIKGIDVQKVGKLSNRLWRKCEELQDKAAEIEEWIEDIPDSEMRTILRLYYRNGLTQREIGKEIGYDQSVVSRRIEDFWAAQESK